MLQYQKGRRLGNQQQKGKKRSEGNKKVTKRNEKIKNTSVKCPKCGHKFEVNTKKEYVKILNEYRKRVWELEQELNKSYYGPNKMR